MTKNLNTTKRLRQGTGEQNKMRSSHYERMKQNAEGGKKPAPTIVVSKKKPGQLKI